MPGFLVDYTVQTVTMGALLIGITSGVLGSFAMLRRQSLLGDAVAHCALPGVAAAFLLTGTKDLTVLLLGAGVSGWLGALLVATIERRTRISYDAALGMILSVFFGFGLVLLTLIQKQPNAAQSGLESFLFGQAATLLRRDVAVMAVLGGAALVACGMLWKEWKLVVFDREYAAALGLPVRGLDVLLTFTLVVAVVIGLQSVGVVLMSAMVVAPAAAARQWTDRFGVMLALAAAVGAAAGVAGVWTSSLVPRMPTGPVIVLFAAGAVVGSMLVGRTRGLVWTWWRRRSYRRGIRLESLLLALHDLAEQHDDPLEAHELSMLREAGMGQTEEQDLLDLLVARGWVSRPYRGFWALTPTGLEIARSVRERQARRNNRPAPEAGRP